MTFGCLANMTEVYISPPQKTKESLASNVSSSSATSSYSATSSSCTDSNPTPLNINPPEPIFEDSPELRRLQKYLSIKKPVVFRVCPLSRPTQSKPGNNDVIIKYPFNVFMYKDDCPKFICVDSYKEVLLCKASKIEPPQDFRDSKEENTNSAKNDIIVRVCVIEDYYSSFSDDVKYYFNQTTISDKYPVLFVPHKTMSLFELKTGSKIILGNNFDFHSDVRSVEVTAVDKRVENVVQKLKSYIADHVKYSKCILNSEVFIEIEDNLICNLKFNPPSEFCLFDEHVLRSCKFYANKDKRLELVKTEAVPNLINIEEVYADVCGFNNIAKQGEALLSIRNQNENILIIGKDFINLEKNRYYFINFQVNLGLEKPQFPNTFLKY